MKKTVTEFYQRYERWWPIWFFVAGFAYDIWSLGPIDSLFGILKQAVFLVVIGLLLCGETLSDLGRFQPKGFVAKLWKYEEELIHFLLGSLLSECSLFFFKSASLWSSFAFLGFLALVILINEFKRFQGGSGVSVRVSLFALCLFAFFGYIVPLILGFVGIIPFLLAILVSATAAWPFAKWMNKLISDGGKTVRTKFIKPFAFTLSMLVVLYFAKLIPPVPISVQFLGVYHEIYKEGSSYMLGYDPRGTSFFQDGEKVFYARPGDKLNSFARVYSPSRFSDQVQLRWLLKDPKAGWQTQDVIKMSIAGGREQGFRGVSSKSHFQPGEWQVRVETTDDREVGRTYFRIENDESTEPRDFKFEEQ